MNVTGTVALSSLKGSAVFSAFVLAASGVIAFIGLVATVVVIARDGYRAIPTRRA